MFGSNSQKLLLLVKLPQNHNRNILNEINLSVQLFGILRSLKTPFSLEAAVHHIGEEIFFYIACPEKSIEFVSNEIKKLWKDAEVELVSDYNIFNFTGVSQGVYFGQKFDCVSPIRTYNEANCDVFIPIVSQLSRVNEIGEGAAIQILAKPVRAKTNPIRSLRCILRSVFTNSFLNNNSHGKTTRPASNGARKQGPLLSINLRILVSAASQYQADEILEKITVGFSQFNAPERQELKIIKPKNCQNLICQFSSREFNDEQSMILNIEELASLFHF